MTPLFQELNRWQGLPTIWGRHDCMLVLADWVLRVTGRDLAADLRGRYYDEASAERVCGWVTDPEGCVASRVEPMLVQIDVAVRRPGDIAILAVPRPGEVRTMTTGALWTGRSWACKGETWGAAELRHSPTHTPVLAAWRVPTAGGRDAA